MPQRTVSSRPQTLRQAKKAYQKAGASPRLSAVEQRRLERSAELQERAARIRAHNLRAKENKRKRAERLEKAREARQRMGQPEPTKNDIGPSQLSLGSFVRTRKGITDEECKPKVELTHDIKPVEVIQGSPIYPDLLKAESPMKPVCILPKSETSPAEKSSTSSLLCPPSPLTNAGSLKKIFVPSTSLMLPPKLPIKRPISYSKPKVTATPFKSEANKPLATDWDIFFDSNTQVEREISNHTAKPPISPTDRNDTVKSVVCPPLDIQTDLFADISTQDLQYYPSSSPLEASENIDVDAEFACGIADEDFGTLIQEADSPIARTTVRGRNLALQ
ncbi:MAG: hypothetical protein Q9220_002765 [cf. Caloplaca sp. 1 TL-2023]